MVRLLYKAAFLILFAFCATSHASSANRFVYLDEDNPFYPGVAFPKLTTPQWVGETGVEAVVILAIDDMRDTPKYEQVLRPILERLKRIDGRAPVSIMCNALAVTNSQLQSWLQEGLSLEVHTLVHPCPLLANGNFAAAASTYNDCIELLYTIPSNAPVAFRMPCCDSMNSPSPRFYAEIFNRTNAAGQFLTIDSSVMNIITTNDASLPREIALDADGRERFRKYLPTQTNAITRVSMGSFVTIIEDYPYPYVIDRLGWQFPAMAPSDWEAHNIHGSNNPKTIEDWKAALDATVIKQGTFTFIFHPHGWIRPDQMVEFIGYAVAKYGRKVKFLHFRDAQQRLNEHLLAGNPLRAANGTDNGLRILDLDDDGFLDVVVGNAKKTRLWNPQSHSWIDADFPTSIEGARFGVVSGATVAFRAVGSQQQAWRFTDGKWSADPLLIKGLYLDGKRIATLRDGHDTGVRFRDVNNDGQCELIVANDTQNAVFGWSKDDGMWKRLPFSLPPETAIVDARGRDAGLRFVDVNGDGYDDVLFSDSARFSLHQFISKANPRLNWEVGWNDEIFSAKRGEVAFDIPAIVTSNDFRNNGVWFRSGHMWVQNEHTANLPDKVDRRSFKQLLSADQPGAKTPADSLASIKVRPGFAAELVAAEPLVTDPISFQWGADGRLWVVEMGDYPLGNDGKGKPGGRVRFLTDTNNDGRFDTSTIFLDGLDAPTGIYPWRKGVIVAAVPDILYAEDTDGDGRADIRNVLFTGFTRGNPQHLLNGFDYGLDGWLYGANGDSGGSIRVPGREGGGVELRGHDFRLHPDKLVFEAIEGQTQYGRHRDDWGNWFGNNNPTWLWHFYLPERYFARNKELAIKSTKQVLADYEDGTRCFPVSRTLQRFNDHSQANHVTSGNSPTPYRDELFGPDFATSVFISEPVHNLIHREVLEPDGVSFKSRRASDERDSEFLASSDNWFRPTMLRTGPDGALYIADMYRQVIEHPEWITKDIQQRLDVRAGSDMGRIYRVYQVGRGSGEVGRGSVEVGRGSRRAVPRMDQLDASGLVTALDSPNGWQRDTAQRLLIERADASAIPLLRTLAQNSTRPLARLHVLYTLAGLSALTLDDLTRAWKDPAPGIREHAVRLAEPFADEIERKAPLREFEALFNDPNIRVQYQLALSLGEMGPKTAAHLAGLALQHPDVGAIQTAVLSSAPKHAKRLVENLLREGAVPPAPLPSGLVAEAVKLAVSQGHESDVLLLLASAQGTNSEWRLTAIGGLLDGLEKREISIKDLAAKHPGEMLTVGSVLEHAAMIAASPDQAEPARLAAIRLMARAPDRSRDELAALGKLLAPDVSPAVQRGAFNQLLRHDDAEVAKILLAHWPHSSPKRRAEILNALLSRGLWIDVLLQTVESGAIPTHDLATPYQQKLLAYADTALRDRAKKLFSRTRPDRKALLEDYKHVAKLNGQPERGETLFQQNCAACHRFKGQGAEVGPDLGAVASKTVDALLVAILDPNAAIETRYMSYLATTKGGRDLTGVITAENANSITLRASGGVDETILRSDLQDLKSMGLSLMPEGIESVLPPQAMADLIAYILSP